MALARTFRAPELALFAALVICTGCRMFRAPEPLHPDIPRGSWYVVQAGESLPDIAKRAGVPLEDLLEINGLERNAVVEPGKMIFVLDSYAVPATQPGIARAPAQDGPPPLRWPLVRPLLSSPFGVREGRPHDGIDLAAPMGTAIYAAAPGQVLYSGDAVRGYGNMVVVQHAGDLLTVYAHGSALLVHTGDRVAAGQEIARVGQTGRATAPHLHFEVRRGQVPKDPLGLLPAMPGLSPAATKGSRE